MCIVTCLSSSHTGQIAPSFTDLTATNVQYDRAAIQWTVPVVAYTHETYVVNYGTDMNILNSMSETVSSGSDFEATDLTFSVLIKLVHRKFNPRETFLVAPTIYWTLFSFKV